MILIITNAQDESTTYVIQWLEFYNKKWHRINESDLIDLDFLGKEIQFTVNEMSFLISEISSVWYRRGFLNFNWEILFQDKSILRVLENEKLKITNFIYYLLNKKKHINTYFKSDLNKLIVTDLAKEIGLNVTDDYLFCNKKELKKLTKIKDCYISKPISGDSIMTYKDFVLFNYTTLIDFDQLEIDQFYPSLVQKYIPKKYELRIFYLEECFYSIAIFSQNDDQTAIDFRNYNKIKPNRRVPFKLPNFIQKKLTLLMNKLNLNCGSIDMIVSPTDQYYFLEVNPVGQFGMVSYPGNYNLEKIIAQYL